MTRLLFLVCALVALVACSDGPGQRPPTPADAPLPPPGPPAPRLDGSIDEWREDDRLAEDPAGDALGAIDVTSLWATNRGSTLFVRIDTASRLNLYNGSPNEGTLQLVIGLGAWGRLVIDSRQRSAWLEHDPRPVGWNQLGLAVAPSYAHDHFELRLDLAPYQIAVGSQVTLELAESDALAEPARLTMTLGEVPLERRAWQRVPGTRLRLASYNTLQAGLVAPFRRDAIARLMRAVGADVYCLQELGWTNPGAIASFLRTASGQDGWNVHRVAMGAIVGNAVASRAPLIPIPSNGGRWASAIVLLPEPVAIFSVHLPCCGYQGSFEDVQRRYQAQVLAETIDQLRAGALGEGLVAYRDVPVVLMGDFNHVGSPEVVTGLPRELEQWMPLQLVGQDPFTWRDESSFFPPATLDLVLHAGLRPRRGFVLDSRSLNASELEALRLEALDSAASDHLVVVADFD